MNSPESPKPFRLEDPHDPESAALRAIAPGSMQVTASIPPGGSSPSTSGPPLTQMMPSGIRWPTTCSTMTSTTWRPSPRRRSWSGRPRCWPPPTRVELADVQGRPRFVLGLLSWVNDYSWPHPPSSVTAPAPKARLCAFRFLRCGPDRVQHGGDAANA